MSNGDDVDQDSQPMLVRTFHGPTVGWRNIPEAEFVDPGPTPVTDFLGLSDTPDSYVGQGGKTVNVNAGGTGLEFVAPVVGGGGGGNDLGWFNVIDFGAVPDNATDSVPGIQAAIDAACAATRGAIYVPPGTYKCYSRPIFLDPPGNMRGSDGVNGRAWSSGFVFSNGGNLSQNNTCNFGGIPYISIQVNNLNHQPDINPLWWRPFNWDVATPYVVSDIVRHGGVPWRCVQANTGQDPMAFASTFWENHYIQPINFAFTLRLFGALGGSHEGSFSSRLNTSDANINRHGIMVGPGQGMQVDHLSIFKADPSVTRKAKKGWGVAIAGGGGGNTRTSVENCLIENFSVGVITGFNQDSLADSNLLYRCAVWGCYIGFQISQTQNFINNVIECSFSNTIGISAINGQAYNVYGGNFSISAYNNVFTIAGTSVVTSGFDPATNTITAVLSGEDQILNDGGYERFAIKTARHGIIPLELVSWDTATNVITLRFDIEWQGAVWGFNFGHATNPYPANFVADVNAQTKLYANEWIRVFIGPARAQGVHIENHNDAHTLLWVRAFFANSTSGSLEDIYYNNDMDGGGPTGDPTVAKYYIQLVTPWILCDINGARVNIRNVGQGSGAGRRAVNIWQGAQNNSCTVTLQHCDTLEPKILSTNGKFRVEQDMYLDMAGSSLGDTYENNWSRYESGHANFLNYFPHPASVPLIQEDTLTAWLNNSALNQGQFQPMCGSGVTYKIIGDETKADIVNIRSNHVGYTNGGNNVVLHSGSTVRNWAYRGGSLFAYVSSFENFRVGMTIILDNGVDGPVRYFIHNQFPIVDPGDGLDGVVHIARVGPPFGGGAGVSGTAYAGALIGQQVPNVTYEVVGQTNILANPSAGFNHVLGNRDTKLVITGSGTLANGTIQLCAVPRDRQVVEIRSGKAITALTIAPTGGKSVAAVPTTIAAGGLISAYFNNADSTWYF